MGRYLRGLPVEARRGGRGYRALKWIQRNRWPAATALAALVALLIFSGGLWLNKLRLEQERNGLQEVARFFSGVFEQAGPLVAGGVDVSLKEALDRSADYLASGPQGEPGVHATLYREAQSILERENAVVHPHLALLHNNLASIYSAQGRLDDMATELEIADHQYRELFGQDNYHRVKPLLGLAIVAKGRGEVERAIELYGQAVEIGRKTTTPSFILRPTYSMARFLLAEGRCREAEKELRASLERLSSREERPWRYYASQSLLGESLLCQGRLNAAALPLRQGLAGLEPDREKVPKAYQRAAESLERLRQLSE